MGINYVMGDFNGWVGDRVREVIAGACRGPNNVKGRRMVNIYANKDLCMDNMYIKHTTMCISTLGVSNG